MSDRRTFTLPAIFENATRRKDGSVSIRFSSAEEMNTTDFATLDMVRNTNGWLLFASERSELPDVPTDPAPAEKGMKTPCQRLRAVLFVKWRSDGSPGDFEQWYREEMRYITDSYKEMLPDNA